MRRLTLVAGLVGVAGCGGATTVEPPTAGPAGTPGPAAPVPIEAAEPVDPSKPPTIKAVMVKLAKGPGSLTPVIGVELKEAEPPWAKLEPQAREFAVLAAALA